MDPDLVFENYYFIINKTLLKLIHIWPYQLRASKRFVRISIISLIHVVIVALIIRTVEELQKDELNVNVVVENFVAFLFFEGISSKYYMSIFSEETFQMLYETIMADFDELIDEGERNVLQNAWSNGRFYTLLYAVYSTVALVGFASMPVLMPMIFDKFAPLEAPREKEIFVYVEYFLDQRTYFWLIFAYTFAATFLTTTIEVSVDGTYLAIVYHAIGLNDIVSYRMKRIFKYIEDEIKLSSNDRDAALHDYVIDSIKLHSKTIEFANKIQDCHSAQLFFGTGCVLLALSIGGIDMMLNLSNPVNFIRIGLVWIGFVIYVFYVSIPGQMLVNSCDELRESLYFCGWYRLPVKTQKLILQMMMRCLVPCQMTAGPLFEMSLANCGLILRTAMSYFTFVASFS